MSHFLKILLIDDDEIDRLLVRKIFEKSAYDVQVVEANDEASALDAIVSDDFDCILLDFYLAGTLGSELLQKIMADSLTQSPIIMLSGNNDDEQMLECLKMGAQDYLLKSELAGSSLLRAIGYAQERKQITEELRFSRPAIVSVAPDNQH